MHTKKQTTLAIFMGILGSFFFAFTFVLNRSMNLGGGYWIWSASLRYFFTLPIMALFLFFQGKWKKSTESSFTKVHNAIRRTPMQWFLWSSVGFGLFYAPLSFAGDYGESWLIAASWQMTIVMGVLLTPLFGKKIPMKNLAISFVILAGIALMQFGNIGEVDGGKVALTLIPIAVGAVSYPLGNRKVMAFLGDEMSTGERVYGMTLCSIPFWILLSIVGFCLAGAPSAGQCMQSLAVALFSGVIATVLFFGATDLVKNDMRALAVVESTQSGEVIFTLLLGVLVLGDAAPSGIGIVGILLIIAGMIVNSLVS